MKIPDVPEPRARARRTGTPARRRDNFALSLLASLLLHSLVLMLEFGTPGLGLPWSGLTGDARRASIPTLHAVLREPAAIVTGAGLTPPAMPALSADQPTAIAEKTGIAPPPPASLQLAAKPAVAQAALRTAPLQAPQQEAPKEVPLAKVVEEPAPASVPAPATPVLSTDKEGPWSTRVAKTAGEDGAQQREKSSAEERAREEELQERKKLEEQVRSEEESRKIEQAAIRAREEARERQRAEDLARREEEKRQAELAAARLHEEALERRRAEELERLKEEKRLLFEQAAAARAREEALARELAAQALLRERQEEAGRLAASAVTAERAARPAAGLPDGGRAAGSGPAAGSGADLAQRALAQARSGSPVPVPVPAEPSRRRGSLLGRDPRDIQLAFYGEGWRQKVERIGSMNYPKLSRNRSYDALVVTVSINSDGTLAGVRIDKSSGYRELDDAVRRIVEMSAPFAAFPPDLKRSYDVVDITRTWSFQDERPRISGQ